MFPFVLTKPCRYMMGKGESDEINNQNEIDVFDSV